MSDADIQRVEVTSLDGIELEVKAKAVAETLSEHYPNHLWQVGWAPGGVLVVKNALIGGGKYGYTIDVPASYSASDLAHTAMIAGGELLERCGLRRGAWNGEDMPTKLEGADPNHLPKP